MSKEKIYWWLKLEKDFFEDDTIQWIEEQENGKDYVIFYLKLCLKSLQDKGTLIRYVGEKLIPYDIKALAKLTNTPADTVAVAMKIFLDIGLIQRMDGGEIFLNQIDEMIGSETDVAKRVRRHRAKKNAISLKEELLLSNMDETKCNTEKDLELDLDLDSELKKKAGKPDRFVEQVIDYLNGKLNSNFKPTTRETVKFVNGRISEGYTLDDFKYVIDVKYEDWFGNEEMQKNLRPSTLFRPGNFENYINQKRVLTNQEKQLLKLKQMREKRQPEYEMLGDGSEDQRS